MKVCPNCNNSIDTKLNSCNYCGYQYPKKDNSKVFIIAIISLLVILIAGALAYIFLSKDKLFTKKVSRTVMIYMVGADLESRGGLATVDIEGINYQKKDKDVNVVMIAGGSKNWKNDYIDTNETSVFELKENGFEKVKTNSKMNMGNYGVLSSFLKYCYENYKTDEYDLIFWNHGGALYGAELDELSGNDILSWKEIDNALKESPFNKENKLEIVGFATCLNSTIEVANVFKDYADYMIASEEVSYGSPYESTLAFVSEIIPDDTPVQIGEKWINNYKEAIKNFCNTENIYSKGGNGEICLDITYSVVDLSKIENVNKAVDDFFEDVNKKVSGNYNSLARTRANIKQYGVTEKSYDMVDLYDMINNYKDLSPSKANKALDSIKSAVKKNMATNDHSNGLSVYFPYNGNYYMNVSKNISFSYNYVEFINKFYKMKESGTTDYYKNIDKSVANVEDNTDAEIAKDFVLELTDEQVQNFAKAGYMVFVDKGDGYYQLIYSSFSPKLEGNKLIAEVRGRYLKVCTKAKEKCQFMILTEEEYSKSYAKYSSAAVFTNYNAPGEKMNWLFDSARFYIVVDEQHPDGYISSAVYLNKEKFSDEDGVTIPGKELLDLSKYENIEMAYDKYKILDENGNYTPDWQKTGTLVGERYKLDDYTFVRQDFNDENNYYAIFRIWDTANNSYYSNLIKLN